MDSFAISISPALIMAGNTTPLASASTYRPTRICHLLDLSVYQCTPALKPTPAEPTHPQIGVRTVTVDAPPGLVLNMLDADETDLWISLQKPESIVCTVQTLPESRTAIHVLLQGEDATNESRLAAARWACRLRDRCENLNKGHE